MNLVESGQMYYYYKMYYMFEQIYRNTKSIRNMISSRLDYKLYLIFVRYQIYSNPPTFLTFKCVQSSRHRHSPIILTYSVISKTSIMNIETQRSNLGLKNNLCWCQLIKLNRSKGSYRIKQCCRLKQNMLYQFSNTQVLHYYHSSLIEFEYIIINTYFFLIALIQMQQQFLTTQFTTQINIVNNLIKYTLQFLCKKSTINKNLIFKLPYFQACLNKEVVCT
eukprot:TRINITY_DN8968_c0_g2_i4.p1 TRINITY_DN8968_c0_g2~~TRINITY_DN8968_c0_g2_i4.p1  ORF type:complete len:221 (-),score=-26.06 TRINITY_DN8968_c0_g2_i4:161-823(-)